MQQLRAGHTQGSSGTALLDPAGTDPDLALAAGQTQGMCRIPGLAAGCI